MKENEVDLSVTIGNLRLKNPVMPSSGTFGYGTEFEPFLDLRDLGAIVVKGTTLHPRLGNPENRFTEIAGCASLFTIGLQNVGVKRFIEEKLPPLRPGGTPVIVNIAGETIEEFVGLTDLVNKTEGIAGIELNLACPNVKKGGAQFCGDPDTTFETVRAVRRSTDLPLIAKVSPLIEIATLGKACEEAGANAFYPNYSVMGMGIDIHTRERKPGSNLLCAVGGPWKKPICVRFVWQAARAVTIPIVGGGGITCAEDAIEFFIAGATAVQIGTYNFIDPAITIKVIQGVRKWLTDRGIRRLGDIIGTFKPS
jgi:dihydroorotate dehydrogenase (NAD+) catalytic subunit